MASRGFALRAALRVLGLAWLAGCAPAGGPESPAPQEARVARLVAELGSQDFRARRRATEALLGIGRPAGPALQEALRSPDPEVRSRAEYILAETRRRGWTLSPELAARMGGLAKGFPDQYLAAPFWQREHLLDDLRRRAPREAEAYLLQAFEEGPEVRFHLVKKLDIYRSPAALAAALAASRDAKPECRSAAAWVLACFPDRAALDRLAELVADEKPSVRESALYSLAGRGRTARAALPAAVKALDDPVGMVQADAAVAVGRLGGRQALPRLWRLADEAPVGSGARWYAVLSIAELAEPDEAAVARGLLQRLDRKNERDDLAVLLARMRARSAAPRVAELLADGEAAGEAAEALAVIGGPAQAPALERCLDKALAEENDWLAARAARALVALGRKDAAAKVVGLLRLGAREDDYETVYAAARALVLTGDPRWAGKLAAAEPAWDGIYQLDLLAFRDGELRVPGAFAARAASRPFGTAFLADHALFAEAAEKLEAGTLPTGRDSPSALVEAGGFLARCGRAREARALLRQAVEMAPFEAANLSAAASALMATLPAAERDPAEALRLAGRAAQVEPHEAGVLGTHAWALFLSGSKHEALRRVDEALAWARPDEPRQQARLGLCRARILAGLGRSKEARGAVSAALARAPRDPEAALEAARALCALGEPAAAVAHLARLPDLTYPDLEALRGDPDLAAARRRGEFAAVLAAAEKLRAEMLAELSRVQKAAEAEQRGGH